MVHIFGPQVKRVGHLLLDCNQQMIQVFFFLSFDSILNSHIFLILFSFFSFLFFFFNFDFVLVRACCSLAARQAYVLKVLFRAETHTGLKESWGLKGPIKVFEVHIFQSYCQSELWKFDQWKWNPVFLPTSEAPSSNSKN